MVFRDVISSLPFVLCHEAGREFSQPVIINTTGPGHIGIAKIKRAELHMISKVLIPTRARRRGVDDFFNDRLSRIFIAAQRPG